MAVAGHIRRGVSDVDDVQPRVQLVAQHLVSVRPSQTVGRTVRLFVRPSVRPSVRVTVWCVCPCVRACEARMYATARTLKVTIAIGSSFRFQLSADDVSRSSDKSLATLLDHKKICAPSLVHSSV